MAAKHLPPPRWPEQLVIMVSTDTAGKIEAAAAAEHRSKADVARELIELGFKARAKRSVKRAILPPPPTF